MSRFLTKILNDKPGEKPKFEVVQTSEAASKSATQSGKEFSTPTPTPTPISTEKKITKAAILIKPEMFRGTSRKTYTVLYNLTRGATVPKRTIKITRNDLMAYADVSEVTLVKHLTYLERVAGIIKKTTVRGDNDGATYEVLVPDEIAAPTATPTTTPTSIKNLYNSPIEIVAGADYSTENKDTYKIPKASLRTNANYDDERAAAFSDVIEKFDAASRKLTGKGISGHDAKKWNDFADLIILELKVAASRADAVSSMPAFLTEVLRRQFFASRRRHSSAESPNAKIGAVGESESACREIKPLDAQERQAALEQIREFAAGDFLQDFRKWYAPDDWTWLMKQLDQA